MVKVYLMDILQLSVPEIFAQEYRKMLPERKQAIDALGKKEDKWRSLAAGILRKRGLLELGIREEEEIFVRGLHGKEYLQGKPRVQFNLSHAGGYAAAAFGEQELGIDIERKDRKLYQVIRRCFTWQEQQYLQQYKGERKQEEAIRLWTRKESFVKATGAGLSYNLQNVEISKGANPVILEKGKFPVYVFYEYEISDYWLTVCSTEQEAEKNPRFMELKKWHK